MSLSTSIPIGKIDIPRKLSTLFDRPLGGYRYRGAYGGRGSGKSFNFAKMAAAFAYTEPLRILCTREFQASIRDSFHAELRNAIASEPWLEAFYDVGVDYIRGANGSEFLFKGLRNSVGSLKSISMIDITIVEEAEDVPELSWLALEATVFRKPRSELWPIWNPKKIGSPVDMRFRQKPPENSKIIEVNYYDNPYLPKPLEDLRLRQREILDANTYSWIWEGAYLTHSKAQILADRYDVREFVPNNDFSGPYFGADWGFAQDPTTLIKAWVYDDCLYVERELYKVGVEITDLPEFFKKIDGAEGHVIRADSARPETISHLKRNGFPRIEGVDKWKGSIEEGISTLRGFKRIVINPRCVNTIKEFQAYSYKTDRLTGDVLCDIMDAENHAIDALRYAITPLIKRKKQGMAW